MSTEKKNRPDEERLLPATKAPEEERRLPRPLTEEAAEEDLSALSQPLSQPLTEGEEGSGSQDEADFAPWVELLEAYPDCGDPEGMPDGFFEAVRSGKSPLMAMHEAEIRRLKGIIAGYEQQEKAAKSCGSLSGVAAPDRDPVLEVLLAE